MSAVHSGGISQPLQGLSVGQLSQRSDDSDPPSFRQAVADDDRPDDGYEAWAGMPTAEQEAYHTVTAAELLGTRRTAPREERESGAIAPLNNMGVHTRHTVHTTDVSKLQVVAGIDKLSFFVFGRWAVPDAHNRYCPDGARAVRAKLVSAQEANRAKDFSARVAVFGGTVCPRGGHPIYGRQVMCPVSVNVDGMRIALGDIDRHQPDAKQKLPVAQVIIDSAALSMRGHHSMLMQAEVILKGLGVCIESVEVLRLDVCADVLGLNAAAFLDYVHKGKAAVTLFDWKKRSTWGPDGALETVAVGTSDQIRLQMYDKLKRILDQVDEGKEREADVMAAALVERWGCMPSDVLRAEFQIGGKWLRKRFASSVGGSGLRTVGEVIERLDAIVEVLFTEQFRIMDREIDTKNRNHARAEVHPIWEKIVDGVRETDFADCELSCECVQRIKREVRKKSVERVRQDLRGVAVRAAAMSLTVEQLQQLKSGEDWAVLLARLAMDSVSSRGDEMCAKAVAMRTEWESKGLVPDACDGAWSQREVLGYEISVERSFNPDADPVKLGDWPGRLMGKSSDEIPF